MIEIYLLEQLAAFAKYGTLSVASEQIHISQPALTRSMKKIEEELDVKLFIRQKNRLILNETGKLAAALAEQLVNQDNQLVQQVRAFDRSLRTIALGSCAPVPILEISPVLQTIFSQMTISTEIHNDEDLQKGFDNHLFQLIVTHEMPEDDALFAVPFGHEKLFIAVPPAHPLTGFDEVRFADLDGVPILQYSKVGFWYDLVHEKIPNANLLLQTDRRTFTEIASASALPTFCTDYVLKDRDLSNRKIIPISDSEASVHYFIVCRKSDRPRFKPLFDHLPKWPT